MRITVPTGQSIKLFDTQGRRKGITLQNLGAVDIFYSDDQRLLDSVTAANLPTVGNILPTAAPVPPPVVYPWYIGVKYARAQNPGGQLEVDVYEVDQC